MSTRIAPQAITAVMSMLGERRWTKHPEHDPVEQGRKAGIASGLARRKKREARMDAEARRPKPQ